MDFLRKLGRSLVPGSAAGETSSAPVPPQPGRTAGRSSSMRMPGPLSGLAPRSGVLRSFSMDRGSRAARAELAKLEAMQDNGVPFEAMLKEIKLDRLPPIEPDARTPAEIKAARRERYAANKQRRGLSQQLAQTLEQRLQERLQRAPSLNVAAAGMPSAHGSSSRLPTLPEQPNESGAPPAESLAGLGPEEDPDPRSVRT